ncbi:hypothetical protein DKX38_004594 [Salix brachista]|uniref:Histidine kinase/HSP90-like ATPase domain-containing protein n=1 Tax=Salix brachista TaxID=2182728 RepID=A0A5N5NAD5_9ROSI|nr:hypothetical protein DKX38_004594 [Salix brachista]
MSPTEASRALFSLTDVQILRTALFVLSIFQELSSKSQLTTLLHHQLTRPGCCKVVYFFRELIGNASDALYKIILESLTDKSNLDSHRELFIRIFPDKVNWTLSITDSEAGMTNADLVNNVGTIARSGTKEFMEALQAGADVGMIGQFGAGIYSAFLVAGKIYTFSFLVTISIQFGLALVQLEERRLKDLVRKHSEFISYPIYLWTEKTIEKEVSDDEDEKTTKEEEGDVEKRIQITRRR